MFLFLIKVFSFDPKRNYAISAIGEPKKFN